jgi:hypothetical protein
MKRGMRIFLMTQMRMWLFKIVKSLTTKEKDAIDCTSKASVIMPTFRNWAARRTQNVHFSPKHKGAEDHRKDQLTSLRCHPI